MRAFVPELTRLPRRRVLTVTTSGDPGKVAPPAIQALYGTAYGTKFKVFHPKGRTMTIGRLAARWRYVGGADPSKLKGRWGLEVSGFVTTRDLRQQDPKIGVKAETWEYGLVAQVLHKGPYSEEGPTVEKLMAFAKEKGYRVVGPHEEEYLTRPDVKVPRTIIRYRVAKRSARARA